jgi:hypothetical protein
MLNVPTVTVVRGSALCEQVSKEDDIAMTTIGKKGDNVENAVNNRVFVDNNGEK